MKMERIAERNVPVPPPPPSMPTASTSYGDRSSSSRSATSAAQDSWDRLFDEAYRADVEIRTEGNGLIYAHASILGTASPVMKGMLKQSRKNGRDSRRKSISILGVPQEAVRVFVRFLYSSRYEKEDMEEFGLNLLALSHVYVVPRLKAECERSLESPGSLSVENVVDVFQLALLCDAPRLGFICHRMIVRVLKSVEATDGWAAMKESHPILEKRILESVTEETNRTNEAMRRRKERKVYLQLSDAMEALVHICRDGCKTIGPQGKELKESHEACRFSEACKGLESLVRHLAGCKLRAPGGCVHCKRMWQLLELHSRLCAHSNSCNVPLCRKFKEKIKKQSKKEEIKWRVLVKKILRANAMSGRPFFSWADPISC